MDVLYAVRTGDDNEELRYSLRSLMNLPHDHVFIAGHRPKWVINTIHIPTSQEHKPDLTNVNNALIAACMSNALSDDFVFMNDDFFICQPVQGIEPMHQGGLNARIEGYKKTAYLQAYSLIKTREKLLHLGYNAPLSYELHMPMVFNKKKLLDMYELCVDLELFALRPRTLYGNLYTTNGAYKDDVKNTDETEQTFLSSDEFSFEISLLGEKIRNTFKTPSPYETADHQTMGFQDAQRTAINGQH